MQLTEEQMKFVEANMATIGYMMANYKEFGEDALKVASDYFYELGKTIGKNTKQKMNITESDVNAVTKVVSAVLEQATGIVPEIKVEEDRAVFVNEGFCPVMEAVKLLNAPWDKVCHNYSLRWFEGVAAGVNPNVKMEVPETRIKGEKCCRHIFTVPK